MARARLSYVAQIIVALVFCGLNRKLCAEEAPFPILITNIEPEDLPELAPLVNTVTYYTAYRPCISPLRSLGVDRASALLKGAVKYDLQVAVSPGIFANQQLEDPTYNPKAVKNLVCDGYRRRRQTLLPGNLRYDLFEPQNAIRVPFEREQIERAFVERWRGKANNFVHHFVSSKLSNSISYWYGVEEVRFWEKDGDYALQKAFRDSLRAEDPRFDVRPLISYVPGHYESWGGTLYTLLEASDDRAESKKVQFEVSRLDQPKSAPRVRSVSLRMQAGAPVRLQSHVMQGNYLGLTLGEYGKKNRILSRHRIRQGLAALENVQRVFKELGLTPPSKRDLVFHMPDLTLTGLPEMNRSFARHDFFSGLHEAGGVFLYNYRYRNVQPEVWEEYKRALFLLKNALSPIMVQGEKAVNYSVSFVDASVTNVISGDDYLRNGGFKGEQWHLPDYSSLEASLWRKGMEGYLLVTNSFALGTQTFEVKFSGDIPALVQQVIPEKRPLESVREAFRDTFEGIDAKVYHLKW